jgi:hypothetical protein
MQTIPEEPDDMGLEPEGGDYGSGGEGDNGKVKILRHSYSIKDKYKTLEALKLAEERVKSELGPDCSFYAISVLELVNRMTGIPISTIKDWAKNKEFITKTYKEQKLARKNRRLGSGNKPLFSKAEKIVADMVRERRRQCQLVSKAFVLKHLRLEAEKENSGLFATCKFSPVLIAGFMRRKKLSLRYPSCIRSDNLDESILICRGFHRQLLSVIADSGPVKYARGPLHPSFGRFLLKYRFNGDEVPYRFGRVKSIVSEQGENVTQVAWPVGWEARL